MTDRQDEPAGSGAARRILPWPEAHSNALSAYSGLFDTGAVLLILGGAVWLRFYRLGVSSLWSDEGNTWALLGRSFARIAHDAAGDIHPPGYYWLLKLWAWLFGATAVGMRSFSAVAGVLLVYIIYRIACTIEPSPSRFHGTALLAAFLAATNPLQVYYSQEARMYMLLALESAGLFWALLVIMARERTHDSVVAPAVWFVLCGVGGLWTHYSFPIVWMAAGVAYLWHWLQLPRFGHRSIGQPANGQTGRPHVKSTTPLLLRFAILNIIILVGFAPWLSTAVNRVLHWPKGGNDVSFFTGWRLTLATLLFGPVRALPIPTWPWLVAAGLLPILGIIAWRRRAGVVALLLWLLAPIGLMFGLGLFSAAFLKFLLAASPVWCLLAAAAARIVRSGGFNPLLLAIGGVSLATLVLPTYYSDPMVRDNYAGVARYIAAVGDPAADLVVLDAPGQQDVWRYYDPGVPVLACLSSDRQTRTQQWRL